MQLRRVQDIEYRLLPGTERRTTDIVIERDGLVTVRPPVAFGLYATPTNPLCQGSEYTRPSSNGTLFNDGSRLDRLGMLS